MADLLTELKIQRLTDASLTYREVGATASETLPPGFQHLTRSRTLIGTDFQRAAGELLSWKLHERSGLRVATSTPIVQPGGVVLMRLGVGFGVLRIPCRVVYLVNESDRVGFAYGTLNGHPESGEERFTVERNSANEVTVRITAFSRPASLLARAGGPISRRMQSAMTDRYLHALDGDG